MLIYITALVWKCKVPLDNNIILAALRYYLLYLIQNEDIDYFKTV